MGVATTCSLFGILEKVSSGSAAGKSGLCASRRITGGVDEVTLGLTGLSYRVTRDTNLSEQFIQACRGQRDSWQEALQEQDIDALLQKLHAIVFAVAQKSGGSIQAKDKAGYVRGCLVRKLFLGCLEYGSLSCDWSAVAAKTLEQISPDQRGFLQHLPKSWSIADTSLFFLSRSSWGIFVPMFACLWHDVAKSRSQKMDILLETVSSATFGSRARALSKSVGHNVCPLRVMESLQ